MGPTQDKRTCKSYLQPFICHIPSSHPPWMGPALNLPSFPSFFLGSSPQNPYLVLASELSVHCWLKARSWQASLVLVLLTGPDRAWIASHHHRQSFRATTLWRGGEHGVPFFNTARNPLPPGETKTAWDGGHEATPILPPPILPPQWWSFSAGVPTPTMIGASNHSEQEGLPRRRGRKRTLHVIIGCVLLLLLSRKKERIKKPLSPSTGL